MTDRKIRSIFPLMFLLLCTAFSMTGSAFASEGEIHDNYLDCPYNDEYTEQAAPEVSLDSVEAVTKVEPVTLSAVTQKPVVTRPYYASSGTDINTPSTTPTTDSTKTDTDTSSTVKPSTGTDTTVKPSTDTTDTGSSKPLTPDGQGTVADNATDEDGKEFFTITTPDENVFCLIIDRQKDSDNVYFLNAVTESDLMALAVKDEDTGVSAIPEPEPVCSCKDKCEAGSVNTSCPVCLLNLKECEGKAPEPVQEEPEPEQPEKKGNSGTMVFVLLAVLAVGGAGYYLKIYKPKHDLDSAEDLDELISDEEEVNEDDAPYYSGDKAPEDKLAAQEQYDEPDEPEDFQ